MNKDKITQIKKVLANSELFLNEDLRIVDSNGEVAYLWDDVRSEDLQELVDMLLNQ